MGMVLEGEVTPESPGRETNPTMKWSRMSEGGLVDTSHLTDCAARRRTGLCFRRALAVDDCASARPKEAA